MSQTEKDDRRVSSIKHKNGFEKKQARAQKEKGLTIVFTGNGKGKTTAAMGMVLRFLGHKKRVGIVQFIKGAIFSAERVFLQDHELCDVIVAGEGYTWETQSHDADCTAAMRGWEQTLLMLKNKNYALLLLDEINVVLKYQLLPISLVLEGLSQRIPGMHVVLTGRHAPAELLEAADLVTEMKLVKHPYREQGIKAQAGVEF